MNEEQPPKTSRLRKTPIWHEDYDFSALALTADTLIDDLPHDYNSIIGRHDEKLWLKAIYEELQSLNKNNTWELVQLPAGRKPIDSKWVFKIKRDNKGSILKYKTRLVARGFLQKYGVDFSDTYAPVAKLKTVRAILALINEKSLCAHQMDVKTAFLNGYLNEEINMVLPNGFKNNKDTQMVCKLNKSIYGLKQASAGMKDFIHILPN